MATCRCPSIRLQAWPPGSSLALCAESLDFLGRVSVFTLRGLHTRPALARCPPTPGVTGTGLCTLHHCQIADNEPTWDWLCCPCADGASGPYQGEFVSRPQVRSGAAEQLGESVSRHSHRCHRDTAGISECRAGRGTFPPHPAPPQWVRCHL